METIYVVTAGWDYEGTSVRWVFTNETAARLQVASVADKIREGATEFGDWVAAKGPYAPGEAIRTDDGKQIAYSNPEAEDRAAEQKVRNKKRKLAKMASATEPTDGYAAMRMRDGG